MLVSCHDEAFLERHEESSDETRNITRCHLLDVPQDPRSYQGVSPGTSVKEKA